MKINFEYCKICPIEKFFSHYVDGFNFKCENCGYFVFGIKKFEFKKIIKSFDERIYFEDVSEEEWIKIKNMEIIEHQFDEYCGYDPNKCPFKLEHMVDQDET